MGSERKLLPGAAREYTHRSKPSFAQEARRLALLNLKPQTRMPNVAGEKNVWRPQDAQLPKAPKAQCKLEGARPIIKKNLNKSKPRTHSAKRERRRPVPHNKIQTVHDLRANKNAANEC